MKIASIYSIILHPRDTANGDTLTLLEEIGTRGGKRVELAGEGSGQTREGARKVNTSLYTWKTYVNQGGEWKDSG